MRIRAEDIARAFSALAKESSDEDLPALADAACEILRAHGLGKFARSFPALVEKEWLKLDGMKRARFTTPSGRSPSAQQIRTILTQALHTPSALEERADPAMIGGAVLEIGDERFEYSIRRMLQEFSSPMRSSLPS